MKRDDASLSHLYAPAIKYHNKLKRSEVTGSDMANRYFRALLSLLSNNF